MLPPDIIDALSKLRMQVPTHGMQHNDAVVFEATGMHISDIFSSFDETPSASGTVAQVHKAVVKPRFSRTGAPCEVAVKVRHPNVEEETFVDIDLIFAFINTLGETFGHFSIPFKKEEFHVVLQRQIDFRWEGHNLYRFCQNFETAPAVIPVSSPASPLPSRDDADAHKMTDSEVRRGARPPLGRWRSEAPPTLGEGAMSAGVCFPLIEDALLSQALLVETWVCLRVCIFGPRSRVRALVCLHVASRGHGLASSLARPRVLTSCWFDMCCHLARPTGPGPHGAGAL